VTAIADDRVADVIEMGRLRFIKNDRVLELAGIAENAAGTDDDIFPDVATVANFASFSDPGRSFDHRALLDNRPLADENGAADEWLAYEAALHRRLEAELQVTGDLL
jgi:hypothetical protein